MPPDLAEAACRLLAARAEGRPIDRLPESCRPTELAQAYAVHELLAAALGPIGGWKVGMAGPGAAPSCAPVFARDILPSGVLLEAARFHRLAVEVEFAFRVERALPDPAVPWDRDEIAAAITFLPVIEVVGGRFAEPDALSPAERLADQNANGALVLGAPVADWRAIDFLSLPVELEIDGVRVQRAVGGHPAGDPVPLVRWQAAHCAAQGRPLGPGDVVTTGSLQGMSPAAAGSRAIGRWDPWGRVEVGFR